MFKGDSYDTPLFKITSLRVWIEDNGLTPVLPLINLAKKLFNLLES